MKKLYFLIWIVILICLIGGCKGRKNPSNETSSHKRERILFERDLKNLVKQGYFVVVDKNESDAYIQENLFGKDLQMVESLARIKRLKDLLNHGFMKFDTLTGTMLRN